MLNKAIIDLNALEENVKKIKSKLHGKAKFCAVVKADAYGHGAEVIANSIYRHVDCYAVAICEEGINLRHSSIDKEILCLTPFDCNEIDRAIYYDLTATVTNLEQLKKLNDSAKKQRKKAKVHIKFNSGMNRQGVDTLSDLRQFLELAKRCDHVEICGLYSHLSQPENKTALKSQVNRFLLANNLIKGYNNNAICHISASGGFLQGVYADMVRIGLLMYGYKPFESKEIEVKPIMKVYASKVGERKIKKGQSALYGQNKAQQDTALNLIRYGYADGLPRAEIGRQFNNRCMDLTAVTDYDQKLTQKGYPILENADILAKQYNTISYEVLTKVAIRAEKIYVR